MRADEHAPTLELAAAVRPSWKCATCGHHRLHHWWHTGRHRDLTPAELAALPDAEFLRCVDADPDCTCPAFASASPFG